MKLIETCGTMHTTIMTVERKLSQNTSLTDKEIESVTKTTSSLVDTMKAGAKLATALRGWSTMQTVHPSLLVAAQ